VIINIDDAKTVIKGYLPDYLAELGLPCDKNEKFVCLNPSDSGSYPSMSYYPDHRMGPCVRCFRCGAIYDIFDLVGMYENIPDFISQLRFLADKYGIQLHDDQQCKFHRNSDADKKVSAVRDGDVDRFKEEKLMELDMMLKDEKELDPVKDATERKQRREAVIARSASGRARAVEYLMSRGIDGALVEKYGIGSVPAYYDAVTHTKWDALVIPLSSDRAVIRNLAPNPAAKERYRKLGDAGMWNIGALYEAVRTNQCVVVTEGEIDALSVISAGGIAVALGGLNFDLLFRELDNVAKSTGKKPDLVIALDTDEVGMEARDKFVSIAKNKKLKYYVLPELHGGTKYKDLNEFLLSDRDVFIKLIGYISGVDGVEGYLFDKEGQNAMYFPSLLDDIAGCNTDNDKRVPTGLDALDDLLGGGIGYGFYILGALPGIGKTTLMLQMVDELAKQGHYVLYYTLDNTRDELIGKSISRLTYEIAVSEYQDIFLARTSAEFLKGKGYSKYTDLEKKVILDACKSYSDFGQRIYMYESLPNIESIGDKIDKMIKHKHKKPVVVVDYMQMIKMDPKADDKRNVDIVLCALKDLARKYSIPVFGISSLNRDNYYNPAKLSGIKSSGEGEYFANFVMILEYTGIGKESFNFDKAAEANPSRVDLVLLKNKMGAKQKRIHLKLFLKYSKFVVVDSELNGVDTYKQSDVSNSINHNDGNVGNKRKK